MFQIDEIKVKTNKIKQVASAKAGILPEHPFRMYIVGASGSGKTNFMLNLLIKPVMYRHYFDTVLVISPTARRLDASYQKLGLSEYNYYEPDEKVLERIQAIQEEAVESKGKNKAPKVLLIMDDVVSYNEFLRSKTLLRFAVMSRHWNVSLIIMSQAYHRIPKSIRLQMTCVIYFKGSNKEQEVLAEDFGAPGLSKKQFIAKINYATEERFNFMFVDINRPLNMGRYRKNLTEQII